MTNRFRLATALLGASLAVPLVAAGPSSADVVPLPTVDTSTTSLGGLPTATGGTVQQRSPGHSAVISKKRQYRLHRSGHHRRR